MSKQHIVQITPESDIEAIVNEINQHKPDTVRLAPYPASRLPGGYYSALTDCVSATLSNTEITFLILDCQRLTAQNIKDIAEPLKKNTHLKILSLKYNLIGDEGAEVLADILKANPSITSLVLGQNNIGPNGAQAIADSLCFNHTLKTLNYNNHEGNNSVFPNNQIGNEGLNFTLQALSQNQSLTTFSATNNNITFAENLLLPTLKDSKLFHIDLSNNPLTTTGVTLWLDYLGENNLTKKLILEQMPLDNQAISKIARLIACDKVNLLNLSTTSNHNSLNKLPLLEATKVTSSLTILNLDLWLAPKDYYNALNYNKSLISIEYTDPNNPYLMSLNQKLLRITDRNVLSYNKLAKFMLFTKENPIKLLDKEYDSKMLTALESSPLNPQPNSIISLCKLFSRVNKDVLYTQLSIKGESEPRKLISSFKLFIQKNWLSLAGICKELTKDCIPLIDTSKNVPENSISAFGKDIFTHIVSNQDLELPIGTEDKFHIPGDIQDSPDFS
jgi:hypothetical protein